MNLIKISHSVMNWFCPKSDPGEPELGVEHPPAPANTPELPEWPNVPFGD